MENNGLCSECLAVQFSLTRDEFQKLRIFLSEALYRKGKPIPSPEVYAFHNMLQDINDEIRKENR